MTARPSDRLSSSPLDPPAIQPLPVSSGGDSVAARSAATEKQLHVGARGLNGVRGRLSDRDLAVLGDVAMLRLITGRQVQRLRVGSTPADARAARRMLQRLTELRLLHRLARRVGGIHAGSSAHVYTLGPIGDRVLRETTGRTSRRRADEVSDGFLDHTLAIAELYVRLVEHHRAGHVELIEVEAEPQSWRRLPATANEWLKPDLAVVTAQGEDEWHHWVEIDRGTEHRPALLRKLHQYEALYRSGREAAQRGLFPRVLWVVPTPARVRLLGHLATHAPNVTPDLHLVCLPDEALPILAGGQPRLSGFGAPP